MREHLRRTAGWVLALIGVYNLILGIVEYDLHPASMIAGTVGLLLGLWLLRPRRRSPG